MSPELSAFAALLLGMAFALAVLRMIGEAITDAFKQDVLKEVDKRKKKKDEYDAYYDERLAESGHVDSVAYYEEVSRTESKA